MTIICGLRTQTIRVKRHCVEVYFWWNTIIVLVELHIQFEEPHDCCVLEITDMTGKVVLKKKIRSKHQEFKLDISALNNGVYFVGLIQGKTAYEPKRLVIQD